MKKIYCSNCKHDCHCFTQNHKRISCDFSKCKCIECECYAKKKIIDKKLALLALKQDIDLIDRLDKKFFKDRDILKAALNSKHKNTWNSHLHGFVNQAKISGRSLIKYVVSKFGNSLQIFPKKFRDDKELVLCAVKENGHAILWSSEKLQADIDVINQAIKTGRVDTGYKGKKFKLILPDISQWHLQLSKKKFKTKKNATVKNLKLKGDDEFGITYYTGETINELPFGKGFSEKYKTSSLTKKVWKKVGTKHRKRYTKNFSINLEGYTLTDKYTGEWKYGTWNGEGEHIEYYEPEYFVNRDGTPKIMNRYIGNFSNGKKEGKFKVYEHMGDDDENNWSTIYYKNYFTVKKRKK